MLVIPAIDLQDGRCVRSKPTGEQKPTGYYGDPVRMAKLWRVLNAKVLHLMDLDGLLRDEETDRETRAKIGAVCESVDIPVQVRGGIRSMDDIETLFALGVYRVVLGSAVSPTLEFLREALAEFGSSRIAVAVDLRDGKVVYEDALFQPERDPIPFVQSIEDAGCRRILLTDMDRAGGLQGADADLLGSIAASIERCRVTVAGGVSGYDDLKKLKSLQSVGVDSVVIERALYENAFPCQQFWCWHDIRHVDLDSFSTASLRE